MEDDSITDLKYIQDLKYIAISYQFYEIATLLMDMENILLNGKTNLYEIDKFYQNLINTLEQNKVFITEQAMLHEIGIIGEPQEVDGELVEYSDQETRRVDELIGLIKPRTIKYKRKDKIKKIEEQWKIK